MVSNTFAIWCRATVVYDRSPEFFRPITLKEKHEVGLIFSLGTCVCLDAVLISEEPCIKCCLVMQSQSYVTGINVFSL